MIKLWFAYILVTLHYKKQHINNGRYVPYSCDLLTF